ncbi:MAG: nitrous oxide reductase accessory protein NosL [Chitinophagales bacterium]|nr:nitrous oxide reductase accessory protein NosL [Chitinophagales bacterium]
MKKPMYLLIVVGCLSLIACAPSPQPIDYGNDMCHYCKMTIVDQQHAAEVITSKGKAYKFDAIECMVNYLGEEPEQTYAFQLVNDYQQPKELIPAEESFYLISEAIPSPMGANLSAFETKAKAKAVQAEKGGNVYSWNALQQQLNH